MIDSLRATNITKYYSRGQICALNSVNLEIQLGKVVVLLGPNGAGKSTLIKILCGVLLPDSGEVTCGEKNIIRNRIIAQKEIGVVFESAQNIYGYLTVEDNLLYFGRLNNLYGRSLMSKVGEYLEIFELETKRKVPVNFLSRGMQQKVAVIIAMLKNPSFLLLDEPTLGLDVLSASKIKMITRSLAREKNKGILLTTHDMSLAEELGDRFIFINKGEIIWNGEKTNFNNFDFFNTNYNIRFYSNFIFSDGDLKYKINTESSNVYNLMCNEREIDSAINYLKSYGVQILSIKTKKPNLEKIFKELMK